MRLILTTLGSRGDVQPFVTLGHEMKRRGHQVGIAAPAEYGDLVAEAQLEHTPLPGAPSEFLPGRSWKSLAEPQLAAMVKHSTSAVRLSRALSVIPKRAAHDPYDLVQALQAASRGADVVVNAVLTRPVHLLTGDETPWAAVASWPHSQTGAFPAFGAPRLPLGPHYNRLTHAARAQLEWQFARRAVNAFRGSTGLPPLGLGSPLRTLGEDIPVFYPFSPSVLRPSWDWPKNSYLTGFWFWDRQWEPSSDLRGFVEEGPPPVVLTLGSMWPIHRRFHVLRMALAAVRKAGQRLVFVGGHPGEPLPSYAFHADEVDYRWLFPRSACVIHHGGPGTMGEALRAGVPQVALPALVDQPFWAAHMRSLGVAAEPVPLPKISLTKLHASLSECLSNAQLARRASQVATYVRSDGGVAEAAEALENWVAGRSPAGRAR
ncbi:nucleotide disphospho-sugar-binding domain-containing protein [Streptomyces platensis]|uniref:nucleotide disphospho-sugar-binding domain-containing protein n=1 Tax=Streptomyces platensis TaxID=58346 RepID=UPI0038705F7B|nr:glycosyltransferase [Streptomyces platensis]